MNTAILQLLIGIGGQIYQGVSEVIKTAKQNKELSDAEYAALQAKMADAFKQPEWQVQPDPPTK